MEAKAVAAMLRQSAPIVERRLQKLVCADDIGLNEGAWPVDRAVDMAFGGEMHDDVRREIRQRRPYLGRVANIASAERIARIMGNRRQRG